MVLSSYEGYNRSSLFVVVVVVVVVVAEAGTRLSPSQSGRRRLASLHHLRRHGHRLQLGVVALEVARVEVDPLVEVPHLDVASLLLVLLVGEHAQPLGGHPQEVDQLLLVRVVAKDLNQTLDEPEKHFDSLYLRLSVLTSHRQQAAS